MAGLLDALIFSGAWVSLAAGALAIAVSLAFGEAADPRVVGLAFTGTFAIYGIDRLRDRERDTGRAPIRSAFVSRWRGMLIASTVTMTGAAALFTFALGPGAVGVSAAAGALGLLHRRLKDRVLFKAGYITAAWIVVVLGLPALTARPDPASVVWVGAVLAPVLLANAISFSVRDEEGLAAVLGRRRSLSIAVGSALVGLGFAALSPRTVRPLAAIALATLASLLAFRADERYAHVAVDGALVTGALLSAALS